MPTVRNQDGTHDVYLPRLDQFTTAEDAARELYKGVSQAALVHGGYAMLETPEDGEFGFSVRWQEGPHQWSHAYIVCDGATAPEFTTHADSAITVRFTDITFH